MVERKSGAQGTDDRERLPWNPREDPSMQVMLSILSEQQQVISSIQQQLLAQQQQIERMSIGGGVDGCYTNTNLPTFDGKQDAFASWARQVKSFMVILDLSDVMTGEAARPTVDDTRADEWRRQNRKAFARLVLSLRGSATSTIDEVEEGDGAALWTALGELYTSVDEEHAYDLMNRLYTAKMDRNEGIDEYCQRIEQMAAQARAAGENVPAIVQKRALINGLPHEFEHAKAALTFSNDVDGAVIRRKLQQLDTQHPRCAKHTPDARKLLDTGEELTRAKIEHVLQQRFESIGRDKRPFRRTRVMAVKAVTKCSQEQTMTLHEPHLEESERENVAIPKHTNGRRRRRRICAICGRTGHAAFECDYSEAGKEEDRQCWNCGEEGHRQWNCPEKRKGKRRRRRCAICGCIGHAAFECDASTAEQEGRQCRKCGAEGHGQWDCPEKRKGKPFKSKTYQRCGDEESSQFEEEGWTRGRNRRRKHDPVVDTQPPAGHFHWGAKGDGYFDDIIDKPR